MQSLDVISVNIWQILISLCNLILLFLILKKLLFKPVRKMLEKRQNSVDKLYADARDAKKKAEDLREDYNQKIAAASGEADAIIKSAVNKANLRADVIVDEARGKAEGIVRAAQSEAELEKRKAQEEIRSEAVDISAALAQKIIEREINLDDHRKIVSSFIEGLGETDE